MFSDNICPDNIFDPAGFLPITVTSRLSETFSRADMSPTNPKGSQPAHFLQRPILKPMLRHECHSDLAFK